MRSMHKVALTVLAFRLAGSAQPPDKETNIKDEQVTFRQRVNLTMVPVVVRDKKGNAVGDLKIDDFQLYDNGKLQFISKFSVEKSGGKPEAGAAKAEPTEPGAPPPPPPPEHFVIYLFDDVHANAGDLMNARNAAMKHLQEKLSPTDRAAIFTTSGQGTQDFTDRKDFLAEALMRLAPRPIARMPADQCIQMSYFIADMIENKNDPFALQAMIQQVTACLSLSGPGAAQTAQSMVHSEARMALTTGEHESRVALSVVKDAIRRLSAAPGMRNLVFPSSG